MSTPPSNRKSIPHSTLFFILCLTQSNLLVAQNKGAPQKSNYWLNVTYINCLKHDLPCACAKKVKTYFIITLDTNFIDGEHGASGLKYNENEFWPWYTKKMNDGEYTLYNHEGDSNHITGALLLKKDTVFLIGKNNNKSTFINGPAPTTGDNESQYQSENIALLNRAFIKRGYGPLEKILQRDTLTCACNAELANVNLISARGTTKAWILEKENSVVSIYSTDISVKTIKPVFNKKLVGRFKW